jgi:hypothetical protein
MISNYEIHFYTEIGFSNFYCAPWNLLLFFQNHNRQFLKSNPLLLSNPIVLQNIHQQFQIASDVSLLHAELADLMQIGLTELDA